MQTYHVQVNYKGEIHKLWTKAHTPGLALKNGIRRVSRDLGHSSPRYVREWIYAGPGRYEVHLERREKKR